MKFAYAWKYGYFLYLYRYKSFCNMHSKLTHNELILITSMHHHRGGEIKLPKFFPISYYKIPAIYSVLKIGSNTGHLLHDAFL